jgi:hypothetical protein
MRRHRAYLPLSARSLTGLQAHDSFQQMHVRATGRRVYVVSGILRVDVELPSAFRNVRFAHGFQAMLGDVHQLAMTA